MHAPLRRQYTQPKTHSCNILILVCLSLSLSVFVSVAFCTCRPAAGVANPLIDEKEWAAISSRHEDQPLTLTSTTPAQAAADWGRAADAVASGRRFVWKVHVNYWTWGGVVAAAIHSAGFPVPHIDFSKGAPPFDGCDYGQIRVSQSVLSLVRNFEKEVGLSGFSDVSRMANPPDSLVDPVPYALARLRATPCL